MKITEISLDCDKRFIDGDYISTDNYVVINDRKEIFRNGNLIKLDKECSVDFPRVRIISPKQFLLMDGEIMDKKGAWIINNQGKIEKSLNIEYAIKTMITQNYIICSYPETCRYNELDVFDKEGNIQFESAKDSKKNNWIPFHEISAFLEKDENTIYYLPYPNLEIIEFNLLDFSSKHVFELPKEIDYATAFSKKGNDWFFITPQNSMLSSIIYKMDANKKVEQIGTCCYTVFPKGLKDGKFFAPFSGGNKSLKNCQFIEV